MNHAPIFMKSSTSAVALAGLLIFLLPFAACKSTQTAEHNAHANPHFTYEGEYGPSHWGDLSEDWILAKTGKRQSPIDIRATSAVAEPGLVLTYKSSPVNIINNGHSVQVNYAEGSSLSIGTDSYALLQFHFHTPSEHTISGEHAPMEVHLVHANSKSELAVLSVMVHEGEANPFLDKIWSDLPEHSGAVQAHADISVNVADLLPSNLSSIRYSGSLTTPPCSENVRWLVLQTSVTASPEQIAKLRAIMGNNARPVQNLNGRMIHSNR